MNAKIAGEKPFEDAIVGALLQKRTGLRWHRGLSNAYNHELGLDTAELATFLGASQNDEWLRLKSAYGDTETPIRQFARLVAKEIDTRGALDVLRHGVKDRGIRIRLAYFKPAHTLAANALEGYESNRLTVVQQFYYSAKEPLKSVDLALFLNGIPIASAELKNNATQQSVAHAKHQYRVDRDPRELFFARRTLVHFAVDPELVFLTTRLDEERTRFLPFNTGSDGPGRDGGAGNKPSVDGYRTSYLWEQVWEPDNWLELLHKFLHVEDPAAKAGRAPSYKPGSAHTFPLIFPRFHQWHAAKQLTMHAQAQGAGDNYLVQHSAGSGKSNTIAWLAHRLSTLHTSSNDLVFDKVVVITDRTVLDKQLQDTIYQFDHVSGVVVRIDENSQQLAEALTGQTARIIITTLQKFPFILDKVGGLGQHQYAVIIDEAHSSQGGEGAADLKRALGRIGTDEDGDPLTSSALARGRQPNMSFFTFTATPKDKTLNLFGNKNPDTGQLEPFHVYSMHQAIEEGFILDVLRNYVTYKTYFKLQQLAADEMEKHVDPRKAKAKLVRAAMLSEASMASRAKVIVEHFRSHTVPKLGGRAKAMVVTSSREHAVLLYQAIRSYVDVHGLTDCGALVAFSGSLTLEKDKVKIEYTEPKLNGFGERELPHRFAYTRADDPQADLAGKQEYRILVVAEKYQTGFDLPLLTTMYVDKVLAGVAAVQTLSRLNRTDPRKSQDDLFILDLRNKAEDIEKAFQPYYRATITEPSDPNLLYDKEHEVMAYRLLVESEMQAFADAYLAAVSASPTEITLQKAHANLYRFTEPAVDRFTELATAEPEKAEAFRSALRDFVRAYGFLAQVVGYNDETLERLYLYGRFLLNRLPRRQDPGVDIGDVVPSHLRIEQTGDHDLRLDPAGNQLLPGFAPGKTGGVAEGEEAPLAEVIQAVNEEYGANLSTADQILLGQLVVAVAENPDMQEVALVNDEETFRRELEKEFDRIVIKQAASNDELLVRYFDDANINRLFKNVATKQAYNLIRRPARREAERLATQERLAAIRATVEQRSQTPPPEPQFR